MSDNAINTVEAQNDFLNIVIVVSQNGQQQIHKHRLQKSSPIILGRSWQSDVIIDDEFIDGSHLSLLLNEEGGLFIEDLNSKNGVYIDKQPIQSLAPYQVGQIVKIGDTKLSIVNADKAVEPAKPFDSAHAFAARFKSFGSVLGATILAGIAMLVSLYFQANEEATSERILGAILGFGIIAFIWSLLAGFMGKIFRHKANVSLHWVFVCLLSAVVVFLGYFLDILVFNLDSGFWEFILQNIFILAVLCLFIYGTLSLTTRFTRGRKLIATGIITVIPALYILISPLLEEEHDAWSYHADIGKSTLPASLYFRQSTNLDEHITALDDLFAELDEQTQAIRDEDKILNKSCAQAGC